MEDLAAFVLIKYAASRHFLHRRRALAIVVDGAAGSDLLGRKRHVEVVIEVAAKRRYPFEAPTHAPLHRGDLGIGSTRYRHVADVMMFEMYNDTVNMVDLE